MKRSRRSKRERERENVTSDRLFHLVLCIAVTHADWEFLRTEINQRRDRFSPSAKSRLVSVCLHLNLRDLT